MSQLAYISLSILILALFSSCTAPSPMAAFTPILTDTLLPSQIPTSTPTPTATAPVFEIAPPLALLVN
jgi:hypothetical protein